MSHILSVAELTGRLKDVLESEFPFVWVRGQVTNLARPASGHIYFTLSDADAALSVVWFRGAQGRGKAAPGGGPERIDPLTGEVVEPGRSVAETLENGQEVLAAGRVSVYAARGNYQLVAELVQASGVSDLALAFEALKRKLAEKGWFDEERKRPLPANPSRVAVVTSAQGAAVRDFLRLAEARGTGCEIRIYPSLVQGDAAPAQLAAAIQAANADDWTGDWTDDWTGGRAEVIALIRGGGSLEDLWAFNSETLAEAVLRSEIPVATGIGHEPDVSIADYVADRRFATPSAVAAGLWPMRADLMQRVDGLEESLSRAFAALMERKTSRLTELSRALAWLSPARRLDRLCEGRREATRRLLLAGGRLVESRREGLRALVRDLLRAFGPEDVDARQEAVRALAAWADLAVTLGLDGAARRAELLAARLAGLDPEGPLARGFSLVRLERTGRLLRAADEAAPGDRLAVRTGRGALSAVVDGITEGESG
jgi:exodeoxyribonuclease VII large subunit